MVKPKSDAGLSLVLMVISFGAALLFGTQLAQASAQDVTVEDMVRFARLGDPLTLNEGDSPTGPPLLSPDGRWWAVVVERGDLTLEANVAQLLIFENEELLAMPEPTVIAEVASKGNRRPIAFVQWLGDSQSLVFAGVEGTDAAQVYRVSIVERKLEQLTHDEGTLSSYEIDDFGSRLVTFRDRMTVGVNSTQKKDGYLVTLKSINDVMRGGQPFLPEMKIHDLTNGDLTILPTDGESVSGALLVGERLSGGISPDGRFGIRRVIYGEWPKYWEDYTGDPVKTSALKMGNRTEHSYSWLLVDFENASTRRLIDGPISTAGNRARVAPVWIDGGKHVIVAGVLEPLVGVEGPELEHRKQHDAVLLINPETLESQRIGVIPSRFSLITDAHWESDTQTLFLNGIDAEQRRVPMAVWRRAGGDWVAAPGRNPKQHERAVQLRIEQSLIDPPMLVATDRGTGAKSTVLDPNPWLSNRRLGVVEHVSWKADDGREWNGGLYLPPDYVPGQRYPLVIQSYVFDPDEFRLDGGIRNHAARPLVANGFIVLQLRGNLAGIRGLPTERPTVQRGFESAVHYLNRRGLVDPARVGVIGFSRSGPHVSYLLTHSNMEFGAAALTDGADRGWWYYLASGARGSLESLHGTAPFGDGLEAWAEQAPTFNLHRVNSPLLLTNAARYPLAVWDWYVGLRSMGKPVELWSFPDGAHDVYQVPQRLRMGYVLVDWFRFWLKDEERDEPSIANGETADSLQEQYARWRELRKQHEVGLMRPRPPLLDWQATPVKKVQAEERS